MKIMTIVGTRPNFMKAAALVDEIKNHNEIEHLLLHTGQHYDAEMSRLFFDELQLPKPDINLEVGSGTYGEQIGNIIIKLEKVLLDKKPDLVVVVGDVNSTLAGALIAKQLGIKVAHVEAGLRSFDLTMPEEINRMLTDRISDFLFTTEESGNINLRREGIRENVFFVGNVMIDTLLKHRKSAENSKIMEKIGLEKDGFCVMTLHRPSNVDAKEGLENIFYIVGKIQERIRVVFPMHPRTRKSIVKFGLEGSISKMRNLIATRPLGYLDFICLMSNAKLVLTDSGGIQEETTVLGVPCITLRKNTERPVTVEKGTNLFVSTNREQVVKKAMQVINGKARASGKIPPLWDGKAASRIVKILVDKLKQN
jgi:UDP-N-acetylglucosamine 2-epimerase (non-hydrolysing)